MADAIRQETVALMLNEKDLDEKNDDLLSFHT